MHWMLNWLCHLQRKEGLRLPVLGKRATGPSNELLPALGLQPMSYDRFALSMERYLPPASIPIVHQWLVPHRIKLKITKPRSSKLGDFRLEKGATAPQISVNGNLNPYAFLITLTHEIAHLQDFLNRGTLREAHGDSWKQCYTQLLLELRHHHIFPEDILPAIDRHIAQPKAASCSDPRLLDALRRYDLHHTIRLKDLPESAHFSLSNGRVFKRGELRRTRYKCQEISSNKWYLIHGEATVEPLDEKIS
jgi:SprT protein